MTFEIGFLFALLAAMVYLFLTEKLPVDLTAFLGLVVLIFGGYLKADEAFQGFASPAVITMLSVFIVGAALLETGVADGVGGRIHSWVGSSEVTLIVTLMLVAGVLSAFMNNIAATAVLMPAVAAIARQAKVAPSRLFIPLAFGAILGGTTTLVGTPPNILAAQLLAEKGLEPFGLFDFTPIGAAILVVGILFMVTLGRKLLPTHEAHEVQGSGAGDLARLYRIDERLFSIRVPERSPLDGVTIGESRLGTTLGVKVVSIRHKGRRQLAPTGESVIHAGDELVVEGEASRLAELLRVQGVEVRATAFTDLPAPVPGAGGVRARVRRSASVIGASLRELGFRERFGVVVVGIQRGDALLRRNLAEARLEADDRILALGPREALTSLSEQPDFEVREIGLRAVQVLNDELFLIRVPEGSELVATSIGASRLGELVGVTVGGLVRGGKTRLAVPPTEILQAGDRLLVTGEPAEILRLEDLGHVEVEEHSSSTADLESEDVGVVEAALSPRSAVMGSTLASMDFTDRYGLLALALWRGGKPIHADLAKLPLQVGDALLLQGPRRKIKRLTADRDWVVMGADQAPRRGRKAPFALAGLLLMIGLVVSGYQPIHVASFTAASLVILSGALTMREAYRAIEWKAIFLVAAVLPVGIAMERSGAAQMMAEQVTSHAGPLGPYAILAALIVLSSLLSQGLDGAPAVVLLTPVVLQTATNLDVSPYPLMMGVSLAASAAFMTPFSHKANLLVMGAGGYKSVDYLRVGTPLTIVLVILMVILVPIFFPF